MERYTEEECLVLGSRRPGVYDRTRYSNDGWRLEMRDIGEEGAIVWEYSDQWVARTCHDPDLSDYPMKSGQQTFFMTKDTRTGIFRLTDDELHTRYDTY